MRVLKLPDDQRCLPGGSGRAGRPDGSGRPRFAAPARPVILVAGYELHLRGDDRAGGHADPAQHDADVLAGGQHRQPVGVGFRVGDDRPDFIFAVFGAARGCLDFGRGVGGQHGDGSVAHAGDSQPARVDGDRQPQGGREACGGDDPGPAGG